MKITADFPLGPDQLLKLLYKDLESWVKPRHGLVSLAGDPGYVLELLADKPAGFRVILGYVGCEDAGDGEPITGIVNHTFEVWLIKDRGMKIDPGTHLIQGDPPFLALLGDLVSRIRSYVFPDVQTGKYLLYKGAKQFEPELALQLPTTGYRMTFELTAALPRQDYRE